MNETVSPDKVETAKPTAPTQPKPPSPPNAPKTRRWGKLALLIAVAAAAVVAWQYAENIAPSTSKKDHAAGPPAQTVRTSPVVTGEMPLTIDALGTVTPFATVTVKTQIAGKLMSVGFTEGQLVKRGDFLAQIDERPYQAALDQAHAQYEKDSALFAQAQADLARYQTLSKQDSISRQQVDDQVFLVAQYRAAMAADKAAIATAALNVSYCRIVSPLDGRVGLRLVDPGNYLQPSDTTGIVVITELDPISVVFSTPEDNLPQISARLKAGATLPVTAFDRANLKQIATGTLTTYDNQIDTTTGTVRLRATFPNPDGALFPNQFVNVRLLVDTLTGAVLAPNPAIQLGANGSFVYVVNADSTVSARNVTIGPGDAKNTTIQSGLTAGQSVVIDGVDRLHDGAAVNVRNTPAKGAAGAPATATPAAGTASPAAGTASPAAGGGHHRHRNGADGAADAPTPSPSASPAQ